MLTMNRKSLPLAAAVAQLVAAGAVHAGTPLATAVAGTTRTGVALWSDWYADPYFSPEYQVNGALKMPGEWTAGTALPKTGSASYTGNLVATEHSRVYKGAVTGGVTLVADFSQSRIAGTFYDFKRADGRGVGGGIDTAASWTASYGVSARKNTSTVDKAFGNIRVNGMAGEVQARFNSGTSAIGGLFWLQRDNMGDEIQVSGTFAANKTVNAVAPVVAVPVPAAKPAAPLPAAPALPASPVPAATATTPQVVANTTPAPAVAKPVPAPVRLTGAFSSWAGTPAANVAMAKRSLVPAGYAVTDTRQGLYAGDVSATVINLRNNGEASKVTGEINVAVNFTTRTVAGTAGNFAGNGDSANFLNSGTLNVSGTLGRTNTISGSAAFTPSNTKVPAATGSFTGLVTNVGTGSQAQGSVGVGNADFTLNGSWRGVSKKPIVQ